MSEVTVNQERNGRREPQVREETRATRCYRPNVDIVETSECLHLRADMPGTSSEDISLDFDNGTLTVSGKVAERQPEGTRFLLREYGVGSFRRVFEITEDIDPEKITADHKNGVLTVCLPKAAARKPRKIEVRAS